MKPHVTIFALTCLAWLCSFAGAFDDPYMGRNTNGFVLNISHTNEPFIYIYTKTNILLGPDYHGTIQVGTNFYHIESVTNVSYELKK